MGVNNSKISYYDSVSAFDIDMKLPNQIFTLMMDDENIGNIITTSKGKIKVCINVDGIEFNYKSCKYSEESENIYIDLKSKKYLGTLMIRYAYSKYHVKYRYITNSMFYDGYCGETEFILI